jgi:hypothetical protein
MTQKKKDEKLCLLGHDMLQPLYDCRNCDTCGWNPVIEKQRKIDLRRAEEEGTLVCKS